MKLFERLAPAIRSCQASGLVERAKSVLHWNSETQTSGETNWQIFKELKVPLQSHSSFPRPQLSKPNHSTHVLAIKNGGELQAFPWGKCQ